MAPARIMKRFCMHLTLQATSCCVCRGAQHDDCIQLLRRLQAAQQQATSQTRLNQLNRPACKDAKLQQPFRMPPKWSSGAASNASPFPDTMLALKSSAEQGRQLVAAHDVAAGSVLWTEESFAHLLLKQHRKQVMSSTLAVIHYSKFHEDAFTAYTMSMKGCCMFVSACLASGATEFCGIWMYLRIPKWQLFGLPWHTCPVEQCMAHCATSLLWLTLSSRSSSTSLGLMHISQPYTS